MDEQPLSVILGIGFVLWFVQNPSAAMLPIVCLVQGSLVRFVSKQQNYSLWSACRNHSMGLLHLSQNFSVFRVRLPLWKPVVSRFFSCHPSLEDVDPIDIYDHLCVYPLMASSDETGVLQIFATVIVLSQRIDFQGFCWSIEKKTEKIGKPASILRNNVMILVLSHGFTLDHRIYALKMGIVME